jgi:hypothetical protein
VVHKNNETQFLKLTEANTEADTSIKAEKLKVVKSLKDREVNNLQNFHLLLRCTYLNFGIIVCGSLVQFRPLANKMLRAVATARAADVGRAGVLGTC